MKMIIKNTMILTAITLISGLLLGLVYEITKGPIAASKERAKQEAYENVLPGAENFELFSDFNHKAVKSLLNEHGYDSCSLDEVIVAKAKDKTVGYIVTSTSTEGYGGDIQIAVGFLKDGTINGISILSISETVGLGMKAKEPEFYKQYMGKKVEQFDIVKANAKELSEIDAISGATVTSEAVTDAVNVAVVYYNEVLGGVGLE